MAEDDLFEKAMGPVKPLTKKEKVQPRKKPPARPRIRNTSHAALAAGDAASMPAAPGPHDTDEPWVLLADGFSRERLRRLAAGQPPIHREIDLHGMRRDEALSHLEHAAEQLLAEGGRVLCIVHGRGLHSQGKAVLREAVYQWLRAGPLSGRVLAVIPAPHTGGGSCLVLFRRRRGG